ncbi:MAG TPA: hypothetical protein VFS09_05045, partial [Candidatus Eisenbacteria bacterium]|nr:hypothetical protein [Candidatus Eisenbacteria bacterium]
AARVDIFPPFQMNEDEWVRVWYSRSGYLGYWIRFVYLESDEPGGEPIRRHIIDDVMSVTQIEIER